MKKIALIMESWERYFTFAWPCGILDRIKQTGEDASLYIFNCSANWNSDALYNKGEHNIFELPRLTDFDGIVVDLTNTRDNAAVSRLLERIRLSGVPAVSIGNRYEGLYHAGVDNHSAMCEIFDHLYDRHGCRSFWCIMGPEDNNESIIRAEALRSRAAEKGISDESFVLCFRDFSVNSGTYAFRELTEKYGSLPDAMICANDNIAVGVLREAQSRGFDAPKDFLITGFDDMDKSRYFTPRISTVSYVREEIGSLCAELLMKLWAGEAVNEMNFVRSKAIFWESCGCNSDIAVDLRQRARDSILWNIDREYFENDVLSLASKLALCGNMGDMINCILESIPSFKCDAMYLIMDKMFENINYGGIRALELDEIAEYEKNLLSVGYSEELSLIFSFENGVSTECRKSIRGLFPLFESDKKGADFLFLPLHLRDRCIGYIAIRNAVYLMDNQFLFSIMNSLITGIEQLYARTKLAKMNEALAAMYHTDSMTGFYNRSGYTDYADDYYERIKAEGRCIAVVYYDLDRLKDINDTFGHEAGDRAIKLTAQTIRKYSSPGAMCFRLGGDEFLVLDSFESRQELEERIHSAENELAASGSGNKVLPELSVSAGYVITDPDSGESLESYVNRADDLMYVSKKAKKLNR